MKQVLEYIVQNYTLFLAGAVLILLAVIGYYADKTNFGQGKNPNNKEKNNSDELKNIEKIETTGIADRSIDNQKQSINDVPVEVPQDSIDDSMKVEEKVQKTKESSNIESMNDATLIESQNIGTSNESNDVGLLQNNSIGQVNLDDTVDLIKNKKINDISKLNNIKLETKQSSVLLNEEAFNKFNDEFNSILPKKELINTDLLSDIDDLELDKTQKLNLNDIPDLANIELPKIKQLASEDEDIWKF